MTTSLLTPSVLGTFRLGLLSPEQGPVVPLYQPLPHISPQGALVPNYDLFLSVASSMYREGEEMRSQRRPTPLASSSWLRLPFFRKIDYKQTMSGLPREVGVTPEDPSLRWIVWETAHTAEGTASLTFHQVREERPLGKRVEIRYGKNAAYVEVAFHVPHIEVSHVASVSRWGEGDFQALSLRLTHEAVEKMLLRSHLGAGFMNRKVRPDILFTLLAADFLFRGAEDVDPFGRELFVRDKDRSTIARPVRYPVPLGGDLEAFLEGLDIRGGFVIEAASSVLTDTLTYSDSVPTFSVSDHPTGRPDGTGTLQIGFVRPRNGPRFPRNLVAFLNLMEREIGRRLDPTSLISPSGSEELAKVLADPALDRDGE